MGGHYERRHVHVIRDGEAEVLPAYKPVENQSVIPAIEQSATQRIDCGVAVFLVEILHIATEKIFAERALPGCIKHWRQRHFTSEG